jgi:ATP-dependent Clp protease protease subunit
MGCHVADGENVVLPRLITLTGVVDWDMVQKTSEGIAFFNAISDKPVVVRVTSSGGILDAGMAVHDLLACSPAPVHIQVYGCADSSAVLISQAGRRRFMAPNATMTVHAGHWSGEANVNAESAAAMADGLRNSDHRYAALVSGRTGNSVAQVLRWMREEKEFTAREAVKHGFADGIIGKPRRK